MEEFHTSCVIPSQFDKSRGNPNRSERRLEIPLVHTLLLKMDILEEERQYLKEAMSSMIK
jgi:hypothetical protein